MVGIPPIEWLCRRQLVAEITFDLHSPIGPDFGIIDGRKKNALTHVGALRQVYIAWERGLTDLNPCTEPTWMDVEVTTQHAHRILGAMLREMCDSIYIVGEMHGCIT